MTRVDTDPTRTWVGPESRRTHSITVANASNDRPGAMVWSESALTGAQGEV